MTLTTFTHRICSQVPPIVVDLLPAPGRVAVLGLGVILLGVIVGRLASRWRHSRLSTGAVLLVWIGMVIAVLPWALGTSGVFCLPSR